MNQALAITELAPGRELDGGKYRLLRLLGAGGMGVVFEAEHTKTRKRVAIKCMHLAHTRSGDSAERLLREAEASGRVRHPNAVDVYDTGRDGEIVFLVMEYLEGEPLSKLLARGGLPMHRIIALLLPAMRAVAEAHRQGVVHRDVKPDNIFLAREADVASPVPKLLDFGISKLEPRGNEQLSLTQSGSTIGTPRYMAYEQLAGDKRIDGRVDVYAFGVILYEALTGRLPYEADTYPELIIKVATSTPVAPKLLRPDVPTALDRLVLWAIAKQRDERIPSIDEFIRELEPFATERGFRSEMTHSNVSLPVQSESAPAQSEARPIRKLPTFAEPERKRGKQVALGASGVALALLALAAHRCGVAEPRALEATPRAATPETTGSLPRQPPAAPPAPETPTPTPQPIAAPASESNAASNAHALQPATSAAVEPKAPARKPKRRPPETLPPQPTAAAISEPPQPPPTGPAPRSDPAAPFRVKLPQSQEF